MRDNRKLAPLPDNSIESLNAHIVHLDMILTDLANTSEQLQSAGATMRGNVDLQRNRVSNAAPSQGDSDYVTRGELRKIGVYPASGQPFVLKGGVVAPQGVQVPSSQSTPSDALNTSGALTAIAATAVPLTRTLEMIGTANQITVSPTGAQDLSADRAWTFSTPQDIHTGATPQFAGLALRDTSAAFNVVIGATSGTALTANRALTLDMGNVAHTLAFGTTANTITFPNAASDTVAMLAVANVFTAAQSVTNTMTANSFIPTSSTIPTNGLYLPAANKVGLATNSTLALAIDSSQRVGIGTASPATSALLELASTTGALLLPRMTSTQRDALTAVNGMLIYNSTTDKFQGYEAGSWTNLI